MVDLTQVPAYTVPYFQAVGNQDPIASMRTNLEEFEAFYKSIPTEKWNYAYAENKWTVKEVLAHVIDSERVFQYRALRFARNDNTDLPGFDQDIFVAAGNSDHRSVESLLDEYVHVRKAGLYLFENLNEEELNREGTANGARVKVLWIAYMLVGHEMHHGRILKERYLG